MAVRYRAELDSLEGVAWKIEIMDSTFVGTAGTFATSFPKISYKGITERTDPILASTLTVPCEVLSGSAFETFITEVMTSQEERFTVIVYRNTLLFWAGVLLQDQVQTEDIQRYTVDLTFTDGLARLKDIPYNNAGTAYTGRATILQHVLNCLLKTGTAANYDPSWQFLKTRINWYEFHHQFAAAKCPLQYSDLHHGIFYEVDNLGVYTYKKAYDVLEMILRTFNARIMMSGGKFVILQAQGNDTPSSSYRIFNTAGTLLTAGNVSTRVTLTDSIRKAGGIHKFFPPLLSVSKNYKVKITPHKDNSFIPYKPKYTTETAFFNTVFESTGGEVTLNFKGTFHEWYKITALGVTEKEFKTRYYVFVRKTKLSDSTVQYLTGNHTDGVIGWSNSSGNYKIDSAFSIGQEWHNSTEFAFSTPKITDDCDVTIQVTTEHFLTNNNQYTPGTGELWDYETLDFICTSSYSFNYTFDDTAEFKTTNTIPSGLPVASKVNLELPETLIGDGIDRYALGKLRATSNGATWYDSAEWGVMNSTTRKDISLLSIQQILAGQRTPTEKYQGGFINKDITAESALVWGAKIMVPLSVDLTLHSDEASGEWFNCAIPA